VTSGVGMRTMAVAVVAALAAAWALPLEGAEIEVLSGQTPWRIYPTVAPTLVPWEAVARWAP
jgi:hypothetical protein